MNLALLLSALSSLLSRIYAVKSNAPLLAEIQRSQLEFSLNTTCPAAEVYNFSNWLSVSEPEQNKTCPLDSEIALLGSTSSNLTSNQRECITTSSPHTAYCVYTFSNFAGGRGLSIVASPSVASSAIGTSSRLDILPMPQTPENFYEKLLPGRGKGLIANQTFQKGDLILTSRPLFMIQEKALSEMSETDRLRLQQLSVAHLPEKSKYLFHSLAGHFGGDRIEDVLLTNGFSAALGDSQEGFGVIVPEAARLNHDCRPNARFAFDSHALIHKVHATRVIEPGEELTFSYIDEKQAYFVRQQIIRAHWGFQCSCKLCSASEDERLRSDNRLRRIAALRKSLFSFTPHSFRTTSSVLALELVSLYEKEGLDGVLAEAYMVAAVWHCASEEVEETKKWAKLAVDHWLVWEAGGATNLQAMRTLTLQPQGQ
ncbi:hypothetical protein BKA65DRAFT_580136 [Rhexocercosporidium sp. MPI-PUGE-AT-0058]|nr:hypothetical protein BKA65DRAFT_580136 [Rhexocercosporidium sp. MPI-PUGE-AT-0058]